MFQCRYLRQKRRNSDAARDQHMLPGMTRQRKVVAGDADFQHIPRLNLLMQEQRAAFGASYIFAPRGDLIKTCFARCPD